MPEETDIDKLSPIKRALYEIRALKARVRELEQAATEPIAIIGLGMRFPDDVSDPESYWRLLIDGLHTITEIPKTRWDLDDYYDADPDHPGKMYTRHGSFLKDPMCFDAGFFGISPREAKEIDPQQRLCLEVAWEALENAGWCPKPQAGNKTGVFLALSNSDYGRLVFNNRLSELGAYSSTGTNFSVAAGRVSYILGLEGPSVVVDTACSGSLVAIHLACQSLRSRESRMALAGGVNLILTPEINVNFSKSRMLARDGLCKTFDASADGYVRGEGCGIVVLKRLSDALHDQDNVIAVIRGSAINHDGRSGGLTVPNGRAQEEVLRQALMNAGARPEEINYVEAHGTGTALGDPVEARALANVLARERNRDNPLIVGSVKTNIGHLESAAGIAGLIKVVLSLEHEQIPRHLHFTNLNPHIQWDDSPVEIPVHPRPWVRNEKKRLAGVSSFGFSGTNAHVVVEEAPVLERSTNAVDRPLHLLALSARSKTALEEIVSRYAEKLDSTTAELADVCFTANAGRAHFDHRAVFVGAASAARHLLRSHPLASGVKDLDWQLIFFFPGYGNQYAGMGKELYDTCPVFRQSIDECDSLLQQDSDFPFRKALWGTGTELLNQVQYAEPALFALEYALAETWKSWGVHPQAVMGHGVGECVAACVAGIHTLEEALKMVAARTRLQRGEGGANSIFEETVAELIYSAPQIEMLAAGRGEEPEPPEINAEYWGKQLNHPGRFQSLPQELARFLDQRSCLEVGPGTERTCGNKGQSQPVWTSSLRAGRGDWEQMLDSLGRLYTAGATVNWDAFDAPYHRRRVPLPTYPFERQRYWIQSGADVTEQTTDESGWDCVREAALRQSQLGPLDLEIAKYPERWISLEKLTSAYIRAFFCTCGIFQKAGERHSDESLISQYGINPSYQRLLQRWLERLACEGHLQRQGSDYVCSVRLTAEDLQQLHLEGERVFLGDRIFFDYVTASGESLVTILTGKKSPLETLFPNGEFSRAEDLYERSPVSIYLNSISRAALEGVLRGRRLRPVSVLEIGAGTGSTTSFLIPILSGTNSVYHFTDVSDIFIRHAERKFAAFPFIKYGLLDIEREGASQGYPAGNFDVVVATNALHATRNIRTTLANVHSLLSPGGILILCEVTEYLPWFDITTGLIEGWQRFDDGLRTDHPLLTTDAWLECIEEAGFGRIAFLPESGSSAELIGQHVFVAESPSPSERRQEGPGSTRILAEQKAPRGETAVETEIDLDTWRNGTATDRRTRLITLINAKLSELLRLGSSDQIQPKTRLIDFGLDSLMALEFRNILAKSLQLTSPLSSTLVFDYPTPEAIASYLEKTILGPKPTPLHQERLTPEMTDRAKDIDALDEHEVELRILKKLQSL